jgi:phosphoglycerate dehydrogenase-like enzyme
VSKPVVLIAEELSPATVEALGPDFEIRRCNGADRDELLPAIADVDAILIRSATKVDAEALAAAQRLKVVARAGVGLDNVDVKAATQNGVMVVNAPTSNIVSAAELAVALMLAAARHIAPANAALKQGEWKRSKYTGIELYEKTVGIVGLGRIGVLVAQRLSAFGMRVIAYDPYVQAGRAAQMGVRLVSLEELVAESDFMSVHLPKTPETVGLISDEQLRKAKPHLVLVNAARGGIVDEEALFEALSEGRIGAAGLDVFAKEPCTDSPLFALENVVATPHLGASTDEAQEKAGIAVAKSVRLALSGELVGADEADGLGGLGQVDADEVGLGEQLVEGDHPDAHLGRAAGLHVRVVGDHVHAERGEPLRDEDADPAEADDAERLLVELDAGVLRPLPLAVAQRRVCRADVPRRGEHQRNGELGGGDDVGRRRVHDHHAVLGRGLHVDVVEPDAGPRDDLEPLGSSERLGVHLGRGAHQDRVDLGDRGEELGAVGTVAVRDLEVRPEGLDGGGAELLSDEYDGLAHVRSFRLRSRHQMGGPSGLRPVRRARRCALVDSTGPPTSSPAVLRTPIRHRRSS